MSNVVVSGYYGSKNAGDEAMLAAMLETFSELDIEVNFTVISSDPEDTTKRHSVNTINWLNFWQIIKAINKADLLISGGGSLLQNVTSGRSLYYYMGILFIGILLKTPVMLYAQGIGPIYGWFPRKIMRWIGNKVTLITVRDSGSLTELEKMGINKPPIKVTADSVLAINPVDISIGKKILEENGISKDKPIIGISVREWQNKSNYKKAIALACDEIKSKYEAQIVFIPMQYPEDIYAAEKIVALMKYKAFVLRDEYKTKQLLSLTGNLTMMISIRLHALIFAGVMNIPMIGISYDPKIERFLNSIGENIVGDLDDISSEDIVKQFNEKMLNKEKFQKENRKQMHNLHQDAVMNAKLALKIINEKTIIL